MAVSFRDADGTTRLSGDLLASGGTTGDVLTQQADGTYTPAAGGGLPDPFVVTGTDPDENTATINGAVGQDSSVLKVLTQEGGTTIAQFVATAAGKLRSEINGTGATVSAGVAEGVASLSGSAAVSLSVPLAEPSDTLLSAYGQVLIWVTNTAGSAKIHFKMYDNADAIVEGSVNLT